MFDMIETKFISSTQPSIEIKASTPEELISYCARVSNPSNQENFDTAKGLLEYCIRNKHWSIFTMVDATVEIKAPRDITRQILRHQSADFQEFSQRYSDEIEFCMRELRMQDKKNRQNSISVEEFYDGPNDWLEAEWADNLGNLIDTVEKIYKEFRQYGVAKEVARVILPEGLTMSTLYMKGNMRTWLHYLDVREGNGTQKEHVDVANKCRKVLEPIFPTILGLEI